MDPQDYSARTTCRPSSPWYLGLNWLGVTLTSLGLAPQGVVTLEVQGRRSGKPRRLPLLRTTHRGHDYLVALAGESQWVRNVRAADGQAVIRRGRARPVQLHEVPEADRAEVIAAYLQAGRQRGGEQTVANQARFYFGIEPDADLDAIGAIADFYPVFRIAYDDEPVSASPTDDRQPTKG